MAYFIEQTSLRNKFHGMTAVLTYNFKTRPCRVKLSTQVNATQSPSLSLIPSETKACR